MSKLTKELRLIGLTLQQDDEIATCLTSADALDEAYRLIAAYDALVDLAEEIKANEVITYTDPSGINALHEQMATFLAKMEGKQ